MVNYPCRVNVALNFVYGDADAIAIGSDTFVSMPHFFQRPTTVNYGQSQH
jgi:hypothetical protein